MTVFAGQPIAASDFNDWLPKSATKAALTGRNTTTTNSADPDLSISLPATSTWRFTADLYLSSAANAAGDWRGAFTWTGTASVTYGGVGIVTAIASGGSGDGIFSPSTRLDSSTPGADFLIGCSTAGISAFITGRIVCTTAVALTLSWSQRVSNGNDTRVLEGSSLTAVRLA